MSAENIQRVIAAIEGDSDIKEKIADAKSLQEVSDILTAAGYQIDPEDFKVAVQSSMPNLSDEELETVTAGTPTPATTIFMTPYLMTSVATISIVVK